VNAAWTSAAIVTPLGCASGSTNQSVKVLGIDKWKPALMNLLHFHQKSAEEEARYNGVPSYSIIGRLAADQILTLDLTSYRQWERAVVLPLFDSIFHCPCGDAKAKKNDLDRVAPNLLNCTWGGCCPIYSFSHCKTHINIPLVTGMLCLK
jgi:hypothetical protein